MQISSKKILVTGGAGFIGSHVVDAYIEDGHDVVIIDNLSTGNRENINPKATFYEMDICDPAIADVFERERPELLNHHAAQTDARVSVRDPQFDLKVNLGDFINLLDGGKKIGLRKVVFASSGGAIYGDQVNFPATEGDVARPVNPYGLNKLACEQYLAYYKRAHGIRWTALRYANVYGPRQNGDGEAGVVAVFINGMLSGNQPIINGDGSQTCDYIYVDDVVKANLMALAEDMQGSYNVGTGIETDVNTLFRAFRELTGIGCEERHGPPQLGEQPRSSISAELLKRRLGWNANVSLPDGLRQTVEWFKDKRSS